MRKLQKNRLVIVIAVIVGVFTCAFISLGMIGSGMSNTPTSVYTGGNDNVARNTATAMATQASVMMQATQPAGGVNEANRISATNVSSEQDSQPQQGQRIVIRNATMNITVEETENRVNEISAMAEGLGGWVVSSSTSISGGTTERPNVYGNITIRVPAESFDSALNNIRDMSSVVNTEQITGQDVTQDYVDTSSQLRNLEAAELQLQTLMESATDVDEVLSVFNQLVQTRSQIEIARGRLQYFDQAAAFSSIAITLNPTSAPVVQAAPVGWNPLSTLHRSVEGLVRFSQTALDNLIALLVYMLPFLIVFGFPLYQLSKWIRRYISQHQILKRDHLSTPAMSDSDAL